MEVCYTVRTPCQVLYTPQIFTSFSSLKLQLHATLFGGPSLTSWLKGHPCHLLYTFPILSLRGHFAQSEIVVLLCGIVIQPVGESGSRLVSVGPRELRMAVTFLNGCLKRRSVSINAASVMECSACFTELKDKPVGTVHEPGHREAVLHSG